MNQPQAPGPDARDNARDDSPDHSADKAWLDRTRTALDEQAETLDYSAQLRLQRAREAALASMAPAHSSKRWWQHQVLWLAAVPAALAIAVAVPLLLPIPSQQADTALAVNDESLQGFDDMSLLAADADLDTLADIEFYQWLADNPDATDA
ncbi:MAG TPA: hypothetical protein VFV64_00320 [Permianibacter sp.]|nr:hypothetical protein [Permianibacter sp.]